MTAALTLSSAIKLYFVILNHIASMYRAKWSRDFSPKQHLERQPSYLAAPLSLRTLFARSVFGPSAAAAQLEGSKKFMKDLCAKYNIPTGRHAAFTDAARAKAYITEQVCWPGRRLQVCACGAHEMIDVLPSLLI